MVSEKDSPEVSFLLQTDDETFVRLEERIKCRSSFAYFVRKFWSTVPGVGKLTWNWHIDVFCEELQRVAERVHKGLPREYDLITNVSPGTTKSITHSVLFHAWIWTWFPEARLLTASHTSDLVLDLAGKARDVIQSDLYRELFPDVEIREDVNAKGHYRNNKGGERKVCTVAGQSPMGFHAHFIIIDDPIDPKKMLSELEMKTAEGFITNVIPNRKVDKRVTVTILVMQRLGLGDPTEVMIRESKKEGAVPVRHVCLPAELTKDVSPPEYRDRYINGLMDPERLGPEVLAENKARGGLFYATQFLQAPYSPEGSMFKEEWFRKRARVRAAPRQATRYRYWDRASTEGGGCRTAGVLMAFDGLDFYVEHVVLGQWESDKRNSMIINTAERDRMRYGPHNDPTIYIEAERGSTGEESFRNLARKLVGFRVKEDMPTGSKDSRAEPWADSLAAGLVILVDDGTWDIAEYIREHVAFRPDVTVKKFGRYKDQVDSSAAAHNLLSGHKVGGKLLRTYSFAERKRKGLFVVVCNRETLSHTIVEMRTLLIVLKDPEGIHHEVKLDDALVNGIEERRRNALVELEQNGSVVVGDDRQNLGERCESLSDRPPPLQHGLHNNLDTLTLDFADVDPAHYQERWNESLPAFGKTCDQVMISREQSKRLWSFLLKKRDKQPEMIVLLSDGGKRALSIAYAISDVLRLNRLITVMGDEDRSHADAKPPNEFVYQQAKNGRSLVC